LNHRPDERLRFEKLLAENRVLRERLERLERPGPAPRRRRGFDPLEHAAQAAAAGKPLKLPPEVRERRGGCRVYARFLSLSRSCGRPAWAC